jgi:pimeloyl-ACP methyl ester carboxylesterase
MAEDAIVLLDFVGWTERRSVHVVGLSMGGMIAQGALVARPSLCSDIVGPFTELACRIPERLVSLSLAVTTAGGLPIFNLPPVRLIEAYLRETGLNCE